MNVLGNRHVGRNLRILLVNNGKGCEFTHHMNMGSILGEKAYPYICAEGHFGHKSSTLVRHYAEDLGFLYLTASSKDEYLKVLPQFLDGSSDSPILLEAFTRDIDENEALKRISQIKKTKSEEFKASVKKMVGKDVYGIFRKVIKK